MVQIVMASLVAVMSLFFASVNSNESATSSSGQTSDYLADVQASGPVVNGTDPKGTSAVPEPATMALIAPLLTGLWVMRRKS